MEGNVKLGSMLMSSVTHEMVTPLKCIASISKSLQNELKHSPKHCKEAGLVYVTTKLLLSEVKLLLDNSMLSNKMFMLQME